MHSLNKKFNKVVCLNLLRRSDKKEYMREKFDKLGIDVEWYHAVSFGFVEEMVKSLKPSVNDFPRFNIKHPNEFGTAISHYTIIKTALIEGHDNIFVFEDDVMFRKNFDEQLDKSLEQLPENWDMILLYSFMYNIQPQNVRVNAKWIKSYDGWSLMSYGMNRKAMEQYIADQDKFFRIADLASFKMQGKGLNIYSAVPTLCIPNVKFGSDIRGENMNYNTHNTILNMGFPNENFE